MLQVLKLEIGGDGHSTINTESSHMHSPDDLSYERGWEFWLAKEAKARNPDIRIGGLAWAHPGWTKNDINLTTSYLVSWVEGMEHHHNVTVDFLGLQNEGTIPMGAPKFGTLLRHKLDAAGFKHTIIDCCDSHDFGFVKQLEDNTTEWFKSVGALAVHEPLRGAESVPANAIATGKPIWSSEAYTTYSDAEGGGCWARALNWGWVKGSVTSHIAWNLIQSYPSVGSGMNYNGHGESTALFLSQCCHIHGQTSKFPLSRVQSNPIRWILQGLCGPRCHGVVTTRSTRRYGRPLTTRRQ
jgi:galactosylceramidase